MLTNEHVRRFLAQGFDGDLSPPSLCELEENIVVEVVGFVAGQVAGTGRKRMYMLGLALDFTLLAQRLSRVDGDAKPFRPTLDEQELFSRYRLITERGDTTANTLTLEFGGVSEGIRKLEESVIALFSGLDRSGYPSAYVYNTGQWHKYKTLLVKCFCLSEEGRLALCLRLLDLGLSILQVNAAVGRRVTRVRLFEEVVTSYPRAAPNENGGLVFQGIAHGFIAADRPHLSIVADKVRTGSARQKRFGDIDCYFGLDIELSVEAKDLRITAENYVRQLEGFVNSVIANNVLGMALVRSIDESASERLIEKGIIVLELVDMLHIIRTWDWQKQNNALHALLHHVAHIEQSAAATERLLTFIGERDANHESLVYAGSSASTN